MPRKLLLVFCLFVFSSQAIYAEENAAARKSRLFESVKYLASDELEGRGIGTEGLDKAADYIAARFKEWGVKTDLFDGSPFQTFTTVTEPKLGPAKKNELELLQTESGQVQQRNRLKLGDDFNTLAIGGSGEFDAPLAFVGYGVTAEELQYDDYAGVDVKGKAVIIVRKTPRQGDPHTPFGGVHSGHAFFSTKVDNAARHGAAAVLLVNDNYNIQREAQQTAEDWRRAVEKLIEAEREFRDKADGSPEALQEHRKKIVQLAERIQTLGKRLEGSFDEILRFNRAGEGGEHPDLPVYFVAREHIDPLIQDAFGKSLAEIEQQIDETLEPQSGVLDRWAAAGQTSLLRKRVKIKNVIGVIEGEGSNADETIVIGAHYDHLGFGGSGSLAPWTTAIHNGADDNASGTAALLEIARALALRPAPPKRRIVLAAFTGEERGLLGSAHYVRNPPFPLETTVAMLNMDMVGRLQDNELVVYGAGTAEEFDDLLRHLNEKHQFNLKTQEGGVGPSDHTSFYRKKIPVMHFFTNSHNDYHRPTDDYDKVNIEGTRRVVDLVIDITDAIASADSPPEYRQTRDHHSVARSGSWPYFGSIPDYGSSEPGAALSGVRPGGPADKAGIKGGDVIVKFGAAKISSVRDFASALSNHKAGDVVPVTVKRDGKEITVDVTLGRRP